MVSDCAKLLKIQLLHFFGINELLHAKDKKKKNRAILMAFCFLMLGAMLMLYVGMMAYSLVYIHLTDLIPAYMFTITSVVILIFTIFKTNGMLFGAKDYEMLTSLPLNPKTIVASRFLTMYVGNLLFSAGTMLPSAFVYVNFAEVGISFYLMLLLSIFLIPLIPLTIASIFGAALAAVTSRLKHKNLFNIIISMVFCIGIIVLSFRSGNVNQQDIANLSVLMAESIQSIYPIAGIYTKAMIENDFLCFLLFAVLSIGIFWLFVILTAWKYVAINSALKARTTKSNYVMKEVNCKSPLQALYEKEAKRYFSSSIYVMNTGIGYVMLLAMAGLLFIFGLDKVETTLNMPGFAVIFSYIAPYVIGAMICMSSTTPTSLSLEGKQWGNLLSLPVTAKTVFDAKILLNLSLSIPTVLITATLFAVTIPMSGLQIFMLYVIPLIYSLFSAVTGIFINRKMPSFDWDNEAIVVKQSASTFINVMVGFASVGIPLALLFILPSLSSIVLWSSAGLLLLLTVLFYIGNTKADLKKIAE